METVKRSMSLKMGWEGGETGGPQGIFRALKPFCMVL